MASPLRPSRVLEIAPHPGTGGMGSPRPARLPGRSSPRLHWGSALGAEAEGTAWVLGAEDQNRPVFRLPPEVSALLAAATAAAMFRPSDDPPASSVLCIPCWASLGAHPIFLGRPPFPTGPFSNHTACLATAEPTLSCLQGPAPSSEPAIQGCPAQSRPEAPTSPRRFPSPDHSAHHRRILRQDLWSRGTALGRGHHGNWRQQGGQVARQRPWAARGLRVTGGPSGAWRSARSWV